MPLVLAHRIRKTGNLTLPDMPFRYDCVTQCTLRDCVAQQECAASHLRELRVALDKLLRASPRKTHRQSAVFVVAFHAHDCSYAIIRMSHLLSEQRIRVGTAFHCWPSKGARAAGTP